MFEAPRAISSDDSGLLYTRAASTHPGPRTPPLACCWRWHTPRTRRRRRRARRRARRRRGWRRRSIDGQAGTTGLQVRGRLERRGDIELITLPEDKRKDAAARAEAINAADAVILCLPDAAAIEAASLVEAGNDRTVLIDASTAHRTNPEWAYGFPELDASQRAKIAASKRIANPGCYATGYIALTAPLVAAGVLAPSAALVASAISGYSGGGNPLIDVFEGGEPHEPWGAYSFALDHKHLPEMQVFSGLERPPIFLPAVGAFAQGMVVSVPIHYDRDLADPAAGGDVGQQVHAALAAHYKAAASSA